MELPQDSPTSIQAKSKMYQLKPTPAPNFPQAGNYYLFILEYDIYYPYKYAGQK